MNVEKLNNIIKEPQEDEIVRFQLKNGLDVVMMKDLSSPIVAVDIWYKVGSKNEIPGKSGFAHLFEHMMFQGSENVGKAEHMKLINDVGGWMNGSTSKDHTNYFEVVPANQLRLALWLESDRMKSLAVNKENFENQRSTVKEERRQRVDNAPYAAVFYELLDELTYENWAYQHSVIGSMKDLDNASLQDVIDFHNTYYRPNNAVLAIVGHINIKETLSIVTEYFENIPSGKIPPEVDLTEPFQSTEKRMTWEDKFAPMSAFACSYHVPAYGQRDYYAMEIIEKVLFDGESSRVYKRLIENEQCASHIYGGVDSKFGPGTFIFFAQVNPSHSIENVEKSFEGEIKRLQSIPLSETEFTKVKNKLRTEFVSKLEKAQFKADQLCKHIVFSNNPEMIKEEIELYLDLTPEQIQKAAQIYLKKNNRSAIKVYPAKEHKAI